jgi:hypothetical protein
MKTAEQVEIELLKSELEQQKAQNIEQKKDLALILTLADLPLPKNGLSTSINIAIAKTLLQEQMAKDNVILSFDEVGNPVLKQRRDGIDLDYFVDNKKMNLESYSDHTLIENKFTAGFEAKPSTQTGADPANTVVLPALKNNSSTLSNPYIAEESRTKLAQLGLTVQEH